MKFKSISKRALTLLLVTAVFIELFGNFPVYADDTDTETHDYVSEVITEASCTEDGEIKYTCTICGDEYTETTNALGHSYETVVTSPTCGEAGYTTYTCSVCGDSYIADETPATGNHIEGDAVKENVVDASCTSDGSYESVVYCTVCGEELSRETVIVSATGHNFDGNICSICGEYKTSLLEEANVTLSSDSYTYDGSEKKPSVTVTVNGTELVSGTDYTVSYSNNTSAGAATVTITGAGGYTGTVSKSFTIAAKTISSTSSAAQVTLSATSYTYNGKARKPTPTVKITLNGSTKTLKKGTDYTVSYQNNTSAGTATVVITGTGNYQGTLKKTFTIKQKSIASESSAAKVSLSKTSYTYNGKARKPTPTVKITLSGSTKTLKKGTDYTVTYSSNKNVGTATVTIKGTGNYKGTVKKTFKIKPKSTSLKSLKAISKGFTAKWTAVSAQASGYQIQYATNKSFTKGKGTVTVSGRTTKTESVTSVKANKKYYVRIRTYKTVNGVKYYSAWSSVKTVTTKKRVTVFAGDSIMSGLNASEYNGVKYMDISGTEKVVAYKGLNTMTYQTTARFSGLTGVEKVIAYQPYRLYIMLGINEISWRSVSAIISDYEDIIDEIQSESPATDIVILAVSPVTKAKATSSTGFKKISSLNKKLKSLAKEYDCTYYDYTAAFKDSSGYLLTKYCSGDGIHWNKAGYKKFAELISAYDAKLEG